MFLKRWWCETYNKPYKDPLLDSYTLEELYYEYCCHDEKRKLLNSKENDDKIDKDGEISPDVEKWIEEEEKREEEERSKKEQPSKENLTLEEIIRQGKEQFGESFGEDING